MEIRTLIERLVADLVDEKISAYRISKETGMGTATLYKLRDGASDIDNISLGYAEKLAQFQLKREADNE